MNSPLYLSNRDIAELSQRTGLDAQMDALIERIDNAFRRYDEKRCSIPARNGFRYNFPQTGLVEWMPLMQHGESVMMKMVGYHPENPIVHKLPTILCTLSLFDVFTGRLKVLADGTFLTCLRTGAASAVASRMLANPESRVVGLVGAGAQAMTQLHAISRVFPIETVLLYDTNKEVARSFAQRIEPLGIKHLDIRIAPIEAVVSEADILCIATTIGKDKGPVFKKSIPLKTGLHINAVGSDLPGKIEVPLEVLKRSFVCPDFLSQALLEGECQQLERSDIGPEIHQLIHSPEIFQLKRNALTVFDSTGFALEDQVGLEFLLEQATHHDVGTQLDLCDHPRDPYNSYEAVFSSGIMRSQEDRPPYFSSYGT